MGVIKLLFKKNNKETINKQKNLNFSFNKADKIKANKEIIKQNKNILGNMTLRNLLDCSLVREEKTDGETTVEKKSIEPSNADTIYIIRMFNIIFYLSCQLIIKLKCQLTCSHGRISYLYLLIFML